MGKYVRIGFLDAMKLIENDKTDSIYHRSDAGYLYKIATSEFSPERLKQAQFYRYYGPEESEEE